jgi:hypothetical protein
VETMSLSMSGGSSEGENEDGVRTGATMVTCPADGLALRDLVDSEVVQSCSASKGTGLQRA